MSIQKELNRELRLGHKAINACRKIAAAADAAGIEGPKKRKKPKSKVVKPKKPGKRPARGGPSDAAEQAE